MEHFWITLLLSTAAASQLSNADDDKIIGGYECLPHSQPWQVYFTYGADKRWCGGSLINEWWILSAAHCYETTLVAHLGEHDTTADEGTEQHIRAAKAIPFPKYNQYNKNNDIMLVKLAQPAQFSAYVRPIPISDKCPVPGTECLVSGWGNLLTSGVQYAAALQCLDVPILADSVCRGAYPGRFTTNMFCAGYIEGGKDSCQGDSGGPVVCDGELTGVVSWGFGCALKNYPGVYTTVCNYKAWIAEVIANN